MSVYLLSCKSDRFNADWMCTHLAVFVLAVLSRCVLTCRALTRKVLARRALTRRALALLSLAVFSLVVLSLGVLLLAVLSLAVCREATLAIVKMPLLLLQPYVTLAVFAGTMVAMAYGALYIFTAENADVDTDTGVVTYSTDDFLFYMRWYYIFGTSLSPRQSIIKSVTR